MSDLILPGDSRRSLTVVIQHDQGRRAIGFCGVCEVPFYSDRDTRAHLRSAAHRDAIDQAMEARRAQQKRLAIFYESVDPEVDEHMTKVGKRMLAEGRMTVKPNERAGF